MEALIFLLVLLTLGICEGDRHVGLRYYEDLYVKPLADGIVANHFTFTTQWDVSPEVLGHSANSGKIKSSIMLCVLLMYLPMVISP